MRTEFVYGRGVSPSLSIATVFRARLRSMLVIHRIPCFILFQHCVQDGQQFSDAGRQCNFFGLSYGNQACIELFVPTRADIQRAVRTEARPPNTVRRPRIVPESLFTGATPIRALISRRESEPGSGTSASNTATVAAPTPLTALSRSDNSLKWSLM